MTVAEELANDSLHNVSSLRERFAAAGERAAELLEDALATSNLIVRATLDLGQSWDTISSKSK